MMTKQISKDTYTMESIIIILLLAIISLLLLIIHRLQQQTPDTETPERIIRAERAISDLQLGDIINKRRFNSIEDLLKSLFRSLQHR